MTDRSSRILHMRSLVSIKAGSFVCFTKRLLLFYSFASWKLSNEGTTAVGHAGQVPGHFAMARCVRQRCPASGFSPRHKVAHTGSPATSPFWASSNPRRAPTRMILMLQLPLSGNSCRPLHQRSAPYVTARNLNHKECHLVQFGTHT